MHAGAMRDRIDIIEPTEVQSTTGHVSRTWASICPEGQWADVQPMNATLSFKAGNQLGGRQGFTVKMRYRADVRSNMRILWAAYCGANQYLEILGIAWDRPRTMLTLQCALEESDGYRNPK